MCQSFTIRAATPDDLPAIASLANSIWPVCYAPILSTAQIEYMLERMYSLDQLRFDFNNGISFDLLLDGDKAIAFAACGPASNRSECKLHKLYLLPAYHGRGLGSRLLKHVIETCRARRYSALSLNVNKQNTPAIALYKRHGFEVRQAVQNDIGSGFIMDDYVMIIHL